MSSCEIYGSAFLGFHDRRSYVAAAVSSGLQAAVKRGLDIVIASAALIALAPLLTAVALWVFLDSPGPILFRQRRYGLHGHAFNILKFRSMRVMENGARVTQAVRGDVRVTRSGLFLRRWSIDELPQLFNVLKGDMSLVGPRPHAVAHDRHYGKLIANYRHRQSVKPGITGWAQVNGHRGETPTIDHMKARLDADIWYARHAHIGLDFVILARTAIEVFRTRNAY